MPKKTKAEEPEKGVKASKAAKSSTSKEKKTTAAEAPKAKAASKASAKAAEAAPAPSEAAVKAEKKAEAKAKTDARSLRAQKAEQRAPILETSTPKGTFAPTQLKAVPQRTAPLVDLDLTQQIEVYGAREHNLKNVSLSFPRNQLVVFTGISGSGKSSLAFDTIYAEGQRRYMETFSAYARSFLGGLERPEVDKIEGLSPVISIEQKTTSQNPRSTVGTITEIYDFMRLLYARTAEAYSYVTGEKMVRQSEDQIINHITDHYNGRRIVVLAPVVKGRKGHYRELFEQIRKLGFVRVRVDGELLELVPKMQLDRYKIHDIEIVIDKIVVSPEDRHRIANAVASALNHGKGTLLVLDADTNKTDFFSRFLMDPVSGIAYDDPAPNNFSFNSPYGACPTCNGLGVVQEITEESVIPDGSLSIRRGAIAPLGEYRDLWIFKQIEALLKRHKLSLTIPYRDLPEPVRNELLFGAEEDLEVKSKYSQSGVVELKFEGIINFLKRQAESDNAELRTWTQEFTLTVSCPECHGARLRKESLHFKLDGRNIAELAQLDIAQLGQWFSGVEERLSERQNVIARELLKEIRKRIGFLLDVGLEYLNLHRPVRTLSGGESQRIRLATQIGTQLVGVLYIMDEPSIGLHQRDNERLINALKNLRDLGNTVLVVEHDKDMILHSDYVVDIGPGAGIHGGHIVAAGDPEHFMAQGSATADYLSGRRGIPVPNEPRPGNGFAITLRGATGNNLRNVTLELPLGRLICLTGVSGSGKSSLIHDTLYPILNKHFFSSKREPLAYKRIEGLEHVDKVIEVDQSPIGRTPRSNPATYTGMFSDIRNLFAQLPEAKIRGYGPGRFSFNVKGGRCETCEGAGIRTIEMNFLPDVHVPCETCKGKRYNRETLEVRFKGKSITDVLDMTVEKAVEFFDSQPRILKKIKVLDEVGLGYITLGQPATTLSGGEAQRVKLATELSKKDTGRTLYILDEPSTGLHFQDIEHLLDVIHKLVNKGNTALVIEHNLDIIKAADWIIDLGPEGGAGGGQIIATGTPREVAKLNVGYTARFLKQELADSGVVV